MSFSCEAWKLIATGGWWSAREVVQRVPLEVEIGTAYSNLFCMAVRHKSLVRRATANGHEYAVTPECIPPRGLTVGEIVASSLGEALAVEAR